MTWLPNTFPQSMYPRYPVHLHGIFQFTFSLLLFAAFTMWGKMPLLMVSHRLEQIKHHQHPPSHLLVLHRLEKNTISLHWRKVFSQNPEMLHWTVIACRRYPIYGKLAFRVPLPVYTICFFCRGGTFCCPYSFVFLFSSLSFSIRAVGSFVWDRWTGWSNKWF